MRAFIILTMIEMCLSLTAIHNNHTIYIPYTIPEWADTCFIKDFKYANVLCRLCDGIMLFVCQPYSCDIIEAHRLAKYHNAKGLVISHESEIIGVYECTIPVVYTTTNMGAYIGDEIYLKSYGRDQHRRQEYSYIYDVARTTVCSTMLAFIFVMMYLCVKQNLRNGRQISVIPNPGVNWYKKVINVEDKNDTCVICIEPMYDGEIVSELNCGHRFKPECIESWIKKENRCPMCNAQVYD
jgi:hypothetical protein